MFCANEGLAKAASAHDIMQIRIFMFSSLTAGCRRGEATVTDWKIPAPVLEPVRPEHTAIRSEKRRARSLKAPRP
jgi:hypothetical protein